MRREDENPGALAGATGADSTAERLALLEQYSNAPAAVHADEIRDMILIALDLLEPDTLTSRNLAEARAALAEALDLIEGDGALPAIAAVPTETPVKRAYRAIVAYREQVESAKLTDDEVDRANDDLRARLDRLVVLPSQGAADTLVKFFAVIEDSLCLDGQPEESALMAEARRFVGGPAA